MDNLINDFITGIDFGEVQIRTGDGSLFDNTHR